MEPNNIAETLRNYAKLPDMSPMLQCVLAEAAATIESLQKENEYLWRVHAEEFGEDGPECE